MMTEKTQFISIPVILKSFKNQNAYKHKYTPSVYIFLAFHNCQVEKSI